MTQKKIQHSVCPVSDKRKQAVAGPGHKVEVEEEQEVKEHEEEGEQLAQLQQERTKQRTKGGRMSLREDGCYWGTIYY